MKKIHFILCVHNHQPVGNFSGVLNEAFQKSYQPWLNTIKEFPCIKWNLHASGILWGWICEYFPTYITDIADMIKKGNLEVLSGGFYEPILPVIPDCDKLGQIRKLSLFLEKEFSCMPEGLWLAERVWEPHLPFILHQAGIRYTVVDDRHFYEAGLTEDELSGYFVTEDQGCPLNVFPISQELRYLVPFASPEATIELLRSKASEDGSTVIVLADDGEKFGIWPGTYERVFNQGWLRRFFQLLSDNADWLVTSTFSEIMRKFPPRSSIYLPSSSYSEMAEWALPVHTARIFLNAENKIKESPDFNYTARFLKGGFWRNFFVRYPESNDMHKKMLLVSEKIQIALEKKKMSPQEQRRIRQAQDYLWAGQCNCAYWHGVFGGLYLPHLRQAVYRNLIIAESLLNEQNQGYTIDVRDVRRLGKQEIVISSDVQNMYFAPQNGGSLYGWDIYRYRTNLCSVLARREEVYHQKILQAVSSGNDTQGTEQVKTIHDMLVMKEDNLAQHLQYDWYQRVSFIDHFFHHSATLDQVSCCQYGEQGDFILNPYTSKIHDDEYATVVSLLREGHVWVDDFHAKILVKKKFIFGPQPGFTVVYAITNNNERFIQLWFGFEMNYMFLEKQNDEKYEMTNVHVWERSDQWLKVCIRMIYEKPCSLWAFPVETVSSAENGFERTYQGAAVISHWCMGLQSGETVEFPVTVSAADYEKKEHD